MTTIKEFCGVNSLYKFPDGREITHEEMYSKVVNAIGLKQLIQYVPAAKNHIIKCLETDKALNNIPLSKWDEKQYAVKSLLASAGINNVSLSDCVCTLKQAARMWAEDK